MPSENKPSAAADTAEHPFRKPVDPPTLVHRDLLGGQFWRRIPAYAGVSEAEFLDHKWQAKHSITNISKLLAAIQGLVPESFIADAQRGLERAPMSVRISPYLVSLIDWANAYDDPLRLQFVPLASRLLPDHPRLDLDSLNERADMPVAGLTHRYVDKALFLALDTCPVYCRFCTRSYAVGIDTEEVSKFQLKVNLERWQQAFDYIASRPELEDIVISGGDAYQLRAEQITQIGEALLGIDHVRRMRYATKGPAVMPQKILTDDAWTDALTRIVEQGRRRHKEVVLHTHFNHPREITEITKMAMDKLYERGITVRNQTVLQRGVNDSVATMIMLVRRLGYVNVQPYYVYMHDLVKGVEDLRTTLETGLEIEKGIRGATAGFNTPTIVVDAPGGGGKRDAHSYEHYDRTTGVSVFTAPAVNPGKLYFYFDPIDLLPSEGRQRWADSAEHSVIVAEARAAVVGKERGRGSHPMKVLEYTRTAAGEAFVDKGPRVAKANARSGVPPAQLGAARERGSRLQLDILRGPEMLSRKRFALESGELPETVAALRAAGRLLALEDPASAGEFVFPRWQIAAPLRGAMPALLKALDPLPLWAKWHFFNSSQPALLELTPLETLDLVPWANHYNHRRAKLSERYPDLIAAITAAAEDYAKGQD